MMTHKTKDTSKTWALAGNELSPEDFKTGIKAAEEASSYSIEESKKIISKWREPKNSK